MAYDTLLEKHRERFLIDLGVTEINRRKAFPELLKDWLAYYGYTQAPLAHAIARWASDNAVPVTAALGVISDNSTGLLWAQGEQGLWYDPSDLSTLFQDSNGTTPVTAMEQPVGLMLDKRLGLVRGGVELVTNGDFAQGSTGWTPNHTGTGTAVYSSGQVSLISPDTNNRAQIRTNIATTPGVAYELRWRRVSGAGLFQTYAGASPPFDLFGAAYNAAGEYRAVFFANNVLTQLTVACYGNGSVEIDNISVRELPGNHASQATTASKPVLSARKNRLLATEDFSSTTWDKAGSASVTGKTAVSFPAGAANTVGFNQVVSGIGQSTTNVISATMSSATGAVVRLKLSQWGTQDYYSPNITLTPTPTRYEFSAAWGAGTGSALVGVVNSTTGAAADFVLDKIQLESGPTATRYQRVNTATDYDWVGFPMYLKFDGVDDFLQTGSINFTATDKMTVVAGVRKLSDAVAIVAELSGNANDNTGSFYLVTGTDAGETGYSSLARGSVAATNSMAAKAFTFLAPENAVITSGHDISGDLSTIRRNGVAGQSGTVDKGTGNFGNYPLYIGRRGGASLPFNGDLYQLGIRGALTEDAKLKSWERDTGNKTGVTIA